MSPLMFKPRRSRRISGIKEQTLAAWKTTGRYNLPVVKIGRLVKYRLRDLQSTLSNSKASHY